MGAKYESKSVVGYNASPPTDDGAVSAANKITWAGILGKVTNPLKTLAEAINTALVAALDTSCREIVASGNTVAGDHLKTVVIASTITSAITVSLGDAATMANGYIVTVANASAIACTVSRATASNTIATATASVAIAALTSITFIVNASANGYLIIGATAITGPATVAQQVAGTSNSVAVTPAVQQRHGSAVKASGALNTAGGGEELYGIASVVDVAFGVVGANLTAPMISIVYTVLATARHNQSSSGDTMLAQAKDSVQTESYFEIHCIKLSDYSREDPNYMSVAVMGVQA